MVSYTLRGVTRRFSPPVRLAGVGVAGEPLGWQNGHEESCRGLPRAGGCLRLGDVRCHARPEACQPGRFLAPGGWGGVGREVTVRSRGPPKADYSIAQTPRDGDDTGGRPVSVLVVWSIKGRTPLASSRRLPANGPGSSEWAAPGGSETVTRPPSSWSDLCPPSVFQADGCYQPPAVFAQPARLT